MVDAAGIREKERVSTRGDLADGKKNRSNNELREVSRGHSTIKKWEGPNNRKSEQRKEGGQYGESRIPRKRGLPTER